MKNAAGILGIIGGILGMITGFFVYGWIEFTGWFSTEVDAQVFDGPSNPLRLQIIGIASPVLAIAGAAMANLRPSIGAVLLFASVAGMIWAIGFGVLTIFPIVMTGLAAIFALLGLATKEPGTL